MNNYPIYIISVIVFSLVQSTVSAASEWLYFKQFPWVYDYHTKDWLYLSGNDGKVYAYRSSLNAWEVFEAPKSWEQQFDTWLLNPQAHGGREVLEQIKSSKLNSEPKLYLADKGIADISPLKALIDLTWLDLSNNNLGSIEHLENLTNLEWLWLFNTNINDVSALSKMSKLEQLSLELNFISDLSPLAKLSNLKWIGLSGNLITNSQKLMLESALPNTGFNWPSHIFDDSQLSWIQDFVVWNQQPEPYGGKEILQKVKEAIINKPNFLSIQAKEISDVSPMAGLIYLPTLILDNNNITDISPLAGLNNLTGLSLGRNNIIDISSVASLNNVTTLNFYSNNITDISSVAGLTNLTSLSLSDNNITDLSPLAGLNSLTTLYLSNNNISDIKLLSGLTNLTYLDLIGNDSISISDRVIIENALPYTRVYWPESHNGKSEWDEKYNEWLSEPEDFGGVEVLERIKNAKANGYEDLSIWGIKDLSPISDLTLLKTLTVSGDSQVKNLQNLDRLRLLTRLFMDNANVEDLSGIESLINLWLLKMDSNNISDLTPIKNLPKLSALYLKNNKISDLSPLSESTTLESLYLSSNDVSDLSSISNITTLKNLDLSYNKISDITSLSNLSNLTSLNLSGNNIADITPVFGLSNLDFLWLDNISDSEESNLKKALPRTVINLTTPNPHPD